MQKSIVEAVVLSLAVLIPRPSHACGPGGTHGRYGGDSLTGLGLAIAALMTVGVADAGVATYDFTLSVRKKAPSQTFAALELAFALPQLVAAGYLMFASTDPTAQFMFGGLAVMSLGLVVHSIYSLANADSARASRLAEMTSIKLPPSRVHRVDRIFIAPAAVAVDKDKRVAPGVALAFRF